MAHMIPEKIDDDTGFTSATFEEIDFSEFRRQDSSPSHDSHSSGVFSPVRLDDGDDVDKVCDADSDSSNQESSFDPYNTRNHRKVKRRTSSNVFTFKKNDPAHQQPLSQSDLKSRRDVLKWQNSASFSSSTEEVEARNRSPQKLQNQPLQYKNVPLNQSSISTSSEETISSHPNLNNGFSPTKSKTAVDGLLFEIYDRYQHNDDHNLLDSDITELSTTSMSSIYVASAFENDERQNFDKSYLETKEITELERMVKELKRGISMLNSKLVRLLKQRDRNAHKIQENFNVLTALLQARSQKRRVDTRIRFSFIPRPGKQGFRQWIDALKAVARMPGGIPAEWRKRTWLSLAEFFLKDIEWEGIKKTCFNDRRNPDDDELDTQIVKDLHRTGCGWFFEHDTAEDRASLKRVLLAYARWNKQIGYCQGFNVIAALILQVMEGNEEHALKVMIFLVDYVLPRNYFSNNLRALSVDMAVLRDLMQMKLGYLANRLQQLQKEAMDGSKNTSASYEPPLINMFTMQWFLTLFATCLPRNTVLRIWDAVLLEGSEVLLRVALALWAKLGSFFDEVETAADFYMTMGKLIQELITDEFILVQKLMQAVYQMASFPWVELTELREKYTYDIHPFTTFREEKKREKLKLQRQMNKPPSDEEEYDDVNDDDVMVGCLGFVAGSSDTPHLMLSSPNKHNKNTNSNLHSAQSNSSSKNAKSSAQHVSSKQRRSRQDVASKNDITKVTPGAYITDQEARNAYKEQMRAKELMRETEKLDVNKLRNQYGRMRRLQQKAMLVFNADDFKDESYKVKNPPSAINHLFVDVNNVVAPPRARYRKPSNFPALKTLGKGGPPAPPRPIKESPKVVHESTSSKGEGETKTSLKKQDSFSITNPYVMLEVQGNGDESDAINDPDAHAHIMKKTAPTNKIRSAPTNQLSAPTKKDSNLSSELNSVSPLYKVDKSALYPTNFKPFPKRNIGKRSNFSSKT
ncbi:TBC1 domain family member 30-like [Clytia hemisphaerica]